MQFNNYENERIKSELNKIGIAHLSHSAIVTYLSNRHQFKKLYIDKDFSSEKSVSAIIGLAYHKALELYYRDKREVNPEKAGEYWDIVLTEEKERNKYLKIDYGKTGSKEKALKQLTQALEYFSKENLKADLKSLYVETGFKTPIKIKGQTLPIDFKFKCDHIFRDSAKMIRIEDFKVVASHSCKNPLHFVAGIEAVKLLKPAYVLQAGAYLLGLESVKIKPQNFVIHEMKKSENKDGSAQLRYIVIDNLKLVKEIFLETYKRVVYELAGFSLTAKGLYLYNPNDLYDKGESWKAFVNEVADSIK